jgi:hypothetical protein
MQSSYRYDIPLDLLAAGRFELKFPFSKKTVRVSLSREAQRSGASVIARDRETTVVIAQRATPAPDAKAPYHLAAQFTVEDCDIAQQ